MPFPLEVVFQTGFTLYAVIRGVVGGVAKVWNPTLLSGAGDWQVFNGANWAQYAIPLTEQSTTGYYSAAYPVNITGVLTSETFYQQAGGSPVLTDAPGAGLTRTQGQNVAAIGGDADMPATLQQALVSEQRGVVAAGATPSVIPTDLANAQANAYAGRSIVFTSGDAFQCAGRIIAYAVTDGVLTLAAPLPVAPDEDSTFVIV